MTQINHSFEDPERARHGYKKRGIVACIVIAMAVILILMRLIYLQGIKHQLYSTLSQKNLLYILPIEPPRGLIYDRNGIVLAKNAPSYDLDIMPAQTTSLSHTIDQIKHIITLSNEEIKSFYHQVRLHKPFQFTTIKSNLIESEIAAIYVNQHRLPGMVIHQHQLRQYPLKAITGQVVGYVARINSQELKTVDSENYSASTHIGKTGIEKYYEDKLHGQVGVVQVETDANSHVIRTLKRQDPIPGDDIYLTLDSRLQQFADSVLGKNSGAIIAIQPSNGEILAMISKPSFDPNLFVNGISKKDYRQLIHAPLHPLYNRAIHGLYSPGSTIKPFIAIGALSSGMIDRRYQIFDPGWFKVPHTNHIYHDWKLDGHGWVNVSKAITVSCDIFFYHLALNFGIKALDNILNLFGFGHKTQIDMPQELAGVVPTPEWKRKVHHASWYTGDTVNMSIGQGSLLVTPLQLAYATTIIAERGKMHRPHLLYKIKKPGHHILINNPTSAAKMVLSNDGIWHTIIHAMQQVVMSPMGTAEQFGRDAHYSVAAKTGTAQVYGHHRDEEYNRANLPKKLRNNHLFICFAPVSHPKIVLVIVVEHAAMADKMARKILDFYFNGDKN